MTGIDSNLEALADKECGTHCFRAKPLQVEGPTPIPEGFELVRTWDDEGTRCNECCNGDRCEDPTHYYRKECPYCKGTGMVQKGALKPKVSKAGAEATGKDYKFSTLDDADAAHEKTAERAIVAFKARLKERFKSEIDTAKNNARENGFRPTDDDGDISFEFQLINKLIDEL